MSQQGVPPHNKDDPIPSTLRRTVDAVKHIRDAFQDGVLMADARKALLSRVTSDIGSTKNSPAAAAELVFWVAQVHALPDDATLGFSMTGDLHPVVAHALACNDVQEFFNAHGLRYWTTEGSYRKRASSVAAPETLADDDEAPAASTPLQTTAAAASTIAASAAAAACAATTSAPRLSIVTIEGVGEVQAYSMADLPANADGQVSIQNRLFVLSTMIDIDRFPPGCVFQGFGAPKGTLVSSQAAIDDEAACEDVESARLNQLIQLAGPSPVRPTSQRARTTPPGSLPSLAQPLQPISARPTASVRPPISAEAPAWAHTGTPAQTRTPEEDSNRYRLEKLRAMRTPFTLYTDDPKANGRAMEEDAWLRARTLPRSDPTRLETVAGLYLRELSRSHDLKMDIIEVMNIMSGQFVDSRDVLHREESTLFDSYRDEDGIEFKGLEAVARKKHRRTKVALTDFSAFIRALTQIQIVENAVFNTYDGADWAHYLKFLNEMHAGEHGGSGGSLLPMLFDDRFRRLRTASSKTVVSLFDAGPANAVYLNAMFEVMTGKISALGPSSPPLTNPSHDEPHPKKAKRNENDNDWICRRYNDNLAHPTKFCGRELACMTCETLGHRSGDAWCPKKG